MLILIMFATKSVYLYRLCEQLILGIKKSDF